MKKSVSSVALCVTCVLFVKFIESLSLMGDFFFPSDMCLTHNIF